MTVRTAPPPTRHPAPSRCLVAPTRDLFLVDLDAFYVSVERRRDPRLRGRPVIVGGGPVDGRSRLRGVVTCASYEARAFGIRAGMPLVQAVALAPPETVFLPGDHRAYRQASKKVLALLETFSPRVEPVSPDEAFLDMTGFERHYRSWLQAAHAIRRAVADATGLSVSIGIGGTRAVAKIAASLAKPDGALEVRRGEEQAFLAALPIEVLPGVGPQLRKKLARFNLHAIGDLAAIGEDVLEETFGVGGVVLSRRARGVEAVEDKTPIGETKPRTRSISRETSFAEDSDDPVWIDGMFSYLAQRATKALRRGGFLARAVGVRLRYADFQTVEARHRLPRPSDADDEILALVKKLWKRRYGRRVKLRLVGVVLHDLVEVTDRQLSLPFPTSPRKTGTSTALADRLDHAVDLIRDRHGFGALVRGRAVGLLAGKTSKPSRGFFRHPPTGVR